MGHICPQIPRIDTCITDSSSQRVHSHHLQITAHCQPFYACHSVILSPTGDLCSACKSKWGHYSCKSLFLSKPAYLWQYVAEQLQILARGCGEWVDTLPLQESTAGGFAWVRPGPSFSPDIFSEARQRLMLGNSRAPWLRSS